VEYITVSSQETKFPYLIWLTVSKNKIIIPNFENVKNIPNFPLKNLFTKKTKPFFKFTHFNLENNFIEDTGQITGFIGIGLNFQYAIRWILRNLHNFHIQLFAIGYFHGSLNRFGQGIPAILTGEIIKQQGFLEQEILVDIKSIVRDEIIFFHEIIPKKPLVAAVPALMSISLSYIKFRRFYFEPLMLQLSIVSPREEKEPIVEVHNLSIGFGKRKIIQNANFTVEKGTIMGIIGESGSGKTITIKALLGALKYTGVIYILGINALKTKRIAPYLGYVPQDLALLYHDFSPLENCIHFGRQYGLDEEYLTRRAKHIFEDLKISHLMSTKVKDISGGEKRRVSIAIALVHDPILIILDEPSSGLDPMARFELWNMLDKINKKYGTTLIVISHYLDEVEYCDKCAIYFNGIGFYDCDTPVKLKEKVTEKGTSVEFVLEKIDLDVPQRIRRLEGVQDVIQRGEIIHILTNSNHEEMKYLIKGKLEDEYVKIFEMDENKELDMMDYFMTLTRRLKLPHSKEKSN
jgi:ABC-2 type transport system ATP-binding protein